MVIKFVVTVFHANISVYGSVVTIRTTCIYIITGLARVLDKFRIRLLDLNMHLLFELRHK